MKDSCQLHLDPDLMLEKAKRTIHQREAVGEQQLMFRGDKADIGEVRKRHKLPKRPGRINRQAKRGSSKNY